MSAGFEAVLRLMRALGCPEESVLGPQRSAGGWQCAHHREGVSPLNFDVSLNFSSTYTVSSTLCTMIKRCL